MGKKRKLKESASSTNNKETSEDSLFPQPLSPSLSEAESENKNDEREDETKKKKSTKKQIPRDENDPFFEVEILGIEREESEEEGEDLFDEKTLTKDYEENPEQDVYDEADFDPSYYEPISAEQKREADKEINERHKKKQRKKGVHLESSWKIPEALRMADEQESDEELFGLKKTITSDFQDRMDLALDDTPLDIPLEEKKGPLREWIVMDGPRRDIAKKFRNFLASFVDNHMRPVYKERIQNMCLLNRQSLEVSYVDLSSASNTLALWVADAPSEMLKIFDEVAYAAVLEMVPEYSKISSFVHVRITDIPLCETLRDIRQVHLNALIKVTGVVTRRTGVFPQLRYVKYNCSRCGFIIGPYYQDPSTPEVKLGSCPQCQSSGPFSINTEQTIYSNFQKISLQESPGSIPPGRLPRTKEIILTDDLIDSARPGEEIEVTGIYKNNFDAVLNTQHGFPVFATIIEANYISKREDAFASFRLTEDDETEILKLSRDPHIGEKIVNSIAPSIYGHEDIKLALALALFGGEAKEVKNSHRIRGDINVLLVGDPGTAKSQFLKYIEKTAYRAVYTTGQGASAVGLTASVRKDPVTKEWTLEGGALVLADNGICLIDEMDKMNDQDRTSIHEAMEQQSISISKAGIVTSLRARCSVIAAANPIKGRYDSSVSFSKNLDLGDPILSRFDIMCVVRDIVEPISDEHLAQFVVRSHRKSHPLAKKNGEQFAKDKQNSEQNKDCLSQDLLRKYIVYAKQRIHPKIEKVNQERITKFFAELRQESKSSGGIIITVRQLDGLIRIAEAYAKIHLRNQVNEDDINMAIRVTLNSFIQTQKYSVARTLSKHFHKYIVYKKDFNQLLLFLLQNLVRECVSYHQIKHGTQPDQIEIPLDDFETRAHEMEITNLHYFYKSEVFQNNKFYLDRQKRLITKSFL